MNITDLKTDIDATPALATALANGDYKLIVAEYSKQHPSATKGVEFMFNKRIFYKKLGLATGLPVIGALEAQTQDPDPTVALQAREVLLLLNDLNQGGGVDASNPEVHYMCDQLVTAGAMTQATCDEIKSWGQQPISIGFEKFGEEVRLGPLEGLRMQGFPDNFILSESKVKSMKLLGNSVAINVIKNIGINIKSYLEQSSK